MQKVSEIVPEILATPFHMSWAFICNLILFESDILVSVGEGYVYSERLTEGPPITLLWGHHYLFISIVKKESTKQVAVTINIFQYTVAVVNVQSHLANYTVLKK